MNTSKHLAWEAFTSRQNVKEVFILKPTSDNSAGQYSCWIAFWGIAWASHSLKGKNNMLTNLESWVGSPFYDFKDREYNSGSDGGVRAHWRGPWLCTFAKTWWCRQKASCRWYFNKLDLCYAMLSPPLWSILVGSPLCKLATRGPNLCQWHSCASCWLASRRWFDWQLVPQVTSFS